MSRPKVEQPPLKLWRMAIDDRCTAAAAGTSGRPRGQPCDWLAEVDQDDQDDPLTVHRPARTLHFINFINFLISEEWESTSNEQRVADSRMEILEDGTGPLGSEVPVRERGFV